MNWPEPPSQPPSPAPNFGVPGQPGFYPLTLGRTVSLAFSLYRFGWRPFVAISVLAAIPVAIVLALVQYATFDPLVTSDLGQSGNAGPIPWSALALSVLASLIVGPFSAVGGAALIHAIVTAITGGRPSTRASYAAAFHRLRDILLVFLALFFVGSGLSVVGLAFPYLSALGPRGVDLAPPVLFFLIVVFVAALFATVYLTIRLVFTVEALMVEGQTAGTSLRRSWSICRGSMWRVVGYAVVFGLIVGLLGLVVEIGALIASFVVAPPQLTGTTFSFNPTAAAVQAFLSTSLAAFLTPIVSIGFLLLYLDVRWRRGEKVLVPGGGESSGPPQQGPR